MKMIIWKMMIQMIMKITDGPTDGKAVIEYTDWDQVDEFARQMAEAIASSNESARQSEDPVAGDAGQTGQLK